MIGDVDSIFVASGDNPVLSVGQMDISQREKAFSKLWFLGPHAAPGEYCAPIGT